MKHPTTIKEVLEAYRRADPAPRPAEFDDAWYAKLKENKKKLLETALQDITRIVEEVIGEDYKHSNGRVMKKPSFECDDCGEPNPEWTINIVKQSLRSDFRKVLE